MPDPVLSTQSGVARCRKKRYPNYFEAWKALDQAASKRTIGKKESSAYRCRHCKGWHLTAQAPRWVRRFG